MKVKAECGCFIGPPIWHSTEVYEPNECCWEGVVDVDEDEWLDEMVSITCPACGTELWQTDDHFDPA